MWIVQVGMNHSRWLIWAGMSWLKGLTLWLRQQTTDPMWENMSTGAVIPVWFSKPRVRLASSEMNTPFVHRHPVALSEGYAGVNHQHQLRPGGFRKAHFQVHWSVLNEAERQVSLRVEAAERLIWKEGGRKKDTERKQTDQKQCNQINIYKLLAGISPSLIPFFFFKLNYTCGNSQLHSSCVCWGPKMSGSGHRETRFFRRASRTTVCHQPADVHTRRPTESNSLASLRYSHAAS